MVMMLDNNQPPEPTPAWLQAFEKQLKQISGDIQLGNQPPEPVPAWLQAFEKQLKQISGDIRLGEYTDQIKDMESDYTVAWSPMDMQGIAEDLVDCADEIDLECEDPHNLQAENARRLAETIWTELRKRKEHPGEYALVEDRSTQVTGPLDFDVNIRPPANWASGHYPDCGHIVDRLNEQHAEINQLRQQVGALKIRCHLNEEPS